MFSRTATSTLLAIVLMVFAGGILATVPSSFAQDLGTSSTLAVAGTSSPLLQYGLAVSGTETKASAEMIAVRQEWDGSGLISTTRYHDRVNAAGDIDNFNVSFHYESFPSIPDASERVQSILNSRSIFGEGLPLDAGVSADPAFETPLPWFAQ